MKYQIMRKLTAIAVLGFMLISLIACNQSKQVKTPASEGVEVSGDVQTTNAPKETIPPVIPEGEGPFARHGALRVDGTKLIDSNDLPFQLMGMSTHGIAWFPDYVNYDAFKTLRDDWNTNCIRIAMYTDESGGYCRPFINQEKLKKLIRNGVDYATELGMYVIIDWHVLNDEDPNLYKEEAIAFFDEMSKLYSDRDNVIYEICNEPCKSATWDGVKRYAEEVIPVIRKNAENAVIIVGTTNWSQDIDKAAISPLEYNNVMYALHFYAATHTDWLRQRLQDGIASGLPVFVSEFGMCDASGNGGNNFDEATKWLTLLDDNSISYICWNLANKDEASSVIAPDSMKTSDWEEKDLSESGQWIRNWFRVKANP